MSYITRLARLFNDLGYAQRRSFELRTGVVLGASQPSRATRLPLSELDANGR